MFKIIGKENGVIWDTINNKPLIKFKKGVAVTKDKGVAEQLKTMGFIVEKETEGNQIEDKKNETQDNQIEDEKNEIQDSQTNDKKEKSKKNERASN